MQIMQIVKAATLAALLASAVFPATALADPAERILNRLILSQTGWVHDHDDDDSRLHHRLYHGRGDDDRRRGGRVWRDDDDDDGRRPIRGLCGDDDDD